MSYLVGTPEDWFSRVAAKIGLNRLNNVAQADQKKIRLNKVCTGWPKLSVFIILGPLLLF